jgi:hypothetical protein
MDLDPLDEYPVHQVPMSFAYVGTSDRNYYDRCIYQLLDHDGETEMLTGLGVYPNLGVIDAFASIRRGDKQWSLQTSGVRPTDRMSQEVGPYRIDVIEPFRTLQLVCEGDDHGLGFDLTFETEYAPMREPQHIKYGGPTNKVTLDGCRYAQLGTWRGELRVDGQTIEVTPDRTTATRDRSWGIRPVGEADPQGQPAAKEPGIWWCWIPLKFEDFGVHFMLDEDPDGFRTVNYGVRVWPSATGRKMEQLGWPEIDIHYRSGTRIPEGATLHCKTVDRKPLEIDITCLTGIPLHLGCGYGSGDGWNHGMWMGDSWTDLREYDYTDPEIQAKVPWGGTDHLARATCDGQTGFGVFEHGSVGRHEPTGMADISAVAP